MRITDIETIRMDSYQNLLLVEIHTDDGRSGLGETFFGARAVEAYIHETAAPQLLGRDAAQIEDHWTRLNAGHVGYGGAGAETRGNSAIDIALWDLFGQATGQPLYQLLGGRVRDKVRTYNTCAGYLYVRKEPVQAVSNWGLPGRKGDRVGPYEDLEGFLQRPGELAQSLLEEGFGAMKIWPFDEFAERSGGHYISNADLAAGLQPFEKIRSEVGDRLDIMVEFHALWDLPAARKITHALDCFEPFWYEDPLRSDNVGALAQLARTTPVPLTLSETLAGRWRFYELMQAEAVGVVMLDIAWVGGISEARKIATMAEAYKLPVAPHDCTGPVVLTASSHFSVSVPNVVVQEVVRAFYHGWYQDIVTDLPVLADGSMEPPAGAGLGTRLQPDLKQRPGTHVMRSELGA